MVAPKVLHGENLLSPYLYIYNFRENMKVLYSTKMLAIHRRMTSIRTNPKVRLHHIHYNYGYLIPRGILRMDSDIQSAGN